MGFYYRKATREDLPLLVETRVKILRAANHLDDSVDLSLVQTNSQSYYEKSLSDGSHIAYLVSTMRFLSVRAASVSIRSCLLITTQPGKTRTS